MFLVYVLIFPYHKTKFKSVNNNSSDNGLHREDFTIIASYAVSESIIKERMFSLKKN